MPRRFWNWDYLGNSISLEGIMGNQTSLFQRQIYLNILLSRVKLDGRISTRTTPFVRLSEILGCVIRNCFFQAEIILLNLD